MPVFIHDGYSIDLYSSLLYPSHKYFPLISIMKWPDNSTTSYNMLDLKSYIKNLYGKYLVIERHMLQIQGLLLQYLKLN